MASCAMRLRSRFSAFDRRVVGLWVAAAAAFFGRFAQPVGSHDDPLAASRDDDNSMAQRWRGPWELRSPGHLETDLELLRRAASGLCGVQKGRRSRRKAHPRLRNPRSRGAHRVGAVRPRGVPKALRTRGHLLERN